MVMGEADYTVTTHTIQALSSRQHHLTYQLSQIENAITAHILIATPTVGTLYSTDLCDRLRSRHTV